MTKIKDVDSDVFNNFYIQNLNCSELVTKIDDQTKMIEHDFRKFQEKKPSHLELV